MTPQSADCTAYNQLIAWPGSIYNKEGYFGNNCTGHSAKGIGMDQFGLEEVRGSVKLWKPRRRTPVGPDSRTPFCPKMSQSLHHKSLKPSPMVQWKHLGSHKHKLTPDLHLLKFQSSSTYPYLNTNPQYCTLNTADENQC